MKRLVLMLGATALVVVTGACAGGSSGEASREVFAAADKYAISQLQVKWHEANSTKNLDEAVNLFADDAVFTLGGETYRGKDQIRTFFLTKAASFKPENDWTSLHPAFKVRITSVEDRGTIHFECHYVDRDSRQFMASVLADAKVARIGERWLFTSLVGANATL